jgi:hypothetical protein
MSESDNVTIVKKFYDDLSRTGKVSILEDYVADDVTIKLSIPEDTPLGGIFRGKDGAMTYFTRVDEAMEILSVDLWDFIPKDDRVVVLGYEKARVRATGKPFESEWVVVFTLANGKFTKLLIIEDVSALVEEFRRTQ